MSKHTPGPWKWMSDHDMGGFHIYMATGLQKTSGYQVHHHLELDFTLYPEDGDQWLEAKANTRLIASAPELLAIIQEIEDCYQRGDDLMPVMDKAQIIISKLTG